MPFRLSIAPSVFQAFVKDVLREMLGKFAIAYIDDILVYSSDLESHISHIRAVLQKFLDNNLYTTGEKCEFHLQSVLFLGYIISSNGVVMDDKKVDAVLNWPTPSSVKELQQFLGFANFYRRFNRGFGSIAAPITALLKGNPKHFQWTEQAEKAFQALKELFSTAPILKHPDPSKPFVAEVDASEMPQVLELYYHNISLTL